jgi:hypothetical protein
MGGKHRLKAGKPRRFADHRRAEARPYNRVYEEIAERFPPRDRLGRRVIGMTADMAVDYECLASPQKPSAREARAMSARRKSFGLFLGGLRVVAAATNGHEPLDLARAIQQAQTETDV